MDIKILSRSLAYIAVVGALVAAAIALNDRQYHATQASSIAPKSGAGDAGLAHCKASGTEGAEAHAPVILDAQRQCARPAGR